MRLVIGDYSEGKLAPGFHETGDDVQTNILQELKGRFRDEYRAANIHLTEEQLLAAATPDQDAIQAVHALGQLDIILNSLGKYTTEWNQLHHPEDTTPWPELATRTLSEPGLQELNVGVAHISALRDTLIEHLDKTTARAMPNTTILIGGVLSAKLLEHAGSLQRLAILPSGTIQILGAERALFRFLRSRDGLPPKYGVLFNHPYVQGVHPMRRGKMARQLANAIAIAVRVDANHGAPIGEELKQKLEAKYRALARP